MNQPSGRHALIAHPATPPRAVEGVFATCFWRGAAEWSFDFTVKAPTAALKLPAPVAPGRGSRLWESTCFEAFLQDPENGSYLEFNFSPSGQWAAYHFDAYRNGMRDLKLATSPLIITTNDRHGLSAGCNDSGLRNTHPWRGGLSAVIEESDGTRSFWALAHPSGKPDFHNARSFLLNLPSVSMCKE